MVCLLPADALTVGARQIILGARPLLWEGSSCIHFQGLLVVVDGLLQIVRPAAMRILGQAVGQLILLRRPQLRLLFAPYQLQRLSSNLVLAGYILQAAR